MFLIELTYQVPWEEVQRHVVEHRECLGRYYAAGTLLVSGPKASKTGGLILSLHKERKEVDALIAEDPFYLRGIASYQVTEFDAVRSHPLVRDLVGAPLATSS
jgi:uncharacterized protein YciI